MYFLPGNIFAAALSKYYLQFLPQFIHRTHTVHIQSDHGSLSSVDLDIALLLQNRIGLIYGMHIDPDGIRQLPYTRQGISLMKLLRGNSHDDLIAQLHIERFITIEIYLYYHQNHSLPTVTDCYTSIITVRAVLSTADRESLSKF